MPTIDNHVAEINKLSFEFFKGIAQSKEPLTYSFSDSNGEVQVEVQAKFIDVNSSIEVIVALDPDDGKSDTVFLVLSPSGEWTRKI